MMRDALVVLAGVSVVSFVVSLIAAPWLLIRLPADYFEREEREPRRFERLPLLNGLEFMEFVS